MLTIYEILFLFSLGSIVGWMLEVIWRPLVETKKLVNPGFLLGPYLPVYGFGTLIAYFVFISTLPFWYKILLFTALATLLEFITGIILSYYKILLWDYSHQPLHFKGYISLPQSVLWGAMGAIFYYLLLPLVTNILSYLSYDITPYLLGLFYGIFIIDLFVTMKLVIKIKGYISKLKTEQLPKIKINYIELKENLNEHMEKIKKVNIFSRFTFSTGKVIPNDLSNQIKILLRKKKE